MDRFHFCVIFSCLVCYSTQQIFRLTESSETPSEGELLFLRCIADKGYDSFQWLLNEEIVVESTIANSNLAPGKNPDQYVVSFSTNQQRRHIFRLDVNPVSRNDTGRWECKVSSTSGSPAPAERRTSISVEYFPDSEYPTCEITASQRPLCITQEGRPLVVLKWAEEIESIVDAIPERASSLNTRNAMVYSEIEPSVLRPPEANSDAVVCKIEQNLESSQCFVSKQDIYILASLNISQRDGETTVSCSVEPSYFWSYLQFKWEHEGQLQGNVSNKGDVSKEVNFGEVTPNLNGSKVICKLEWGVFDYKNVSLPLVVNEPPTTLASFSTMSSSTPSSSKPTKRPSVEDMNTKQSVDKDVNVKTDEPRPRDAIKVTTKPRSRDVVTPTTETETFTFIDLTTKFYEEFSEFDGQMTLLILVLSAVILPILLLMCIVCICVLCKRMKSGTAAVI